MPKSNLTNRIKSSSIKKYFSRDDVEFFLIANFHQQVTRWYMKNSKVLIISILIFWVATTLWLLAGHTIFFAPLKSWDFGIYILCGVSFFSMGMTLESKTRQDVFNTKNVFKLGPNDNLQNFFEELFKGQKSRWRIAYKKMDDDEPEDVLTLSKRKRAEEFYVQLLETIAVCNLANSSCFIDQQDVVKLKIKQGVAKAYKKVFGTSGSYGTPFHFLDKENQKVLGVITNSWVKRQAVRDRGCFFYLSLSFLFQLYLFILLSLFRQNYLWLISLTPSL